jgi:hypothetical protein
MYVYFMACGESVKIGKTRNVAERMNDMQVGNPVKLEVLKAVRYRSDEDALKAESDAHKALKAYNTRGEWFLRCDDVTAYMRLSIPCQPLESGSLVSPV